MIYNAPRQIEESYLPTHQILQHKVHNTEQRGTTTMGSRKSVNTDKKRSINGAKYGNGDLVGLILLATSKESSDFLYIHIIREEKRKSRLETVTEIKGEVDVRRQQRNTFNSRLDIMISDAGKAREDRSEVLLGYHYYAAVLSNEYLVKYVKRVCTKDPKDISDMEFYRLGLYLIAKLVITNGQRPEVVMKFNAFLYELIIFLLFIWLKFPSKSDLRTRIFYFVNTMTITLLSQIQFNNRSRRTLWNSVDKHLNIRILCRNESVIIGPNIEEGKETFPLSFSASMNGQLKLESLRYDIAKVANLASSVKELLRDEKDDGIMSAQSRRELRTAIITMQLLGVPFIILIHTKANNAKCALYIMMNAMDIPPILNGIDYVDAPKVHLLYYSKKQSWYPLSTNGELPRNPKQHWAVPKKSLTKVCIRCVEEYEEACRLTRNKYINICKEQRTTPVLSDLENAFTNIIQTLEKMEIGYALDNETMQLENSDSKLHRLTKKKRRAPLRSNSFLPDVKRLCRDSIEQTLEDSRQSTSDGETTFDGEDQIISPSQASLVPRRGRHYDCSSVHIALNTIFYSMWRMPRNLRKNIYIPEVYVPMHLQNPHKNLEDTEALAANQKYHEFLEIIPREHHAYKLESRSGDKNIVQYGHEVLNESNIIEMTNGEKIIFLGPLVNHSKVHANLRGSIKKHVFKGETIIYFLFTASKPIRAMEELLWNYGDDIDPSFMYICPCSTCIAINVNIIGKCHCSKCQGKSFHTNEICPLKQLFFEIFTDEEGIRISEVHNIISILNRLLKFRATNEKTRKVIEKSSLWLNKIENAELDMSGLRKKLLANKCLGVPQVIRKKIMKTMFEKEAFTMKELLKFLCYTGTPIFVVDVRNKIPTLYFVNEEPHAKYQLPVVGGIVVSEEAGTVICHQLIMKDDVAFNKNKNIPLPVELMECIAIELENIDNVAQ
uniref:SET domain-containing protein n=1 Tax=Heterorhabditis bacteriophora TaxID=37862 RepID=A0A1I7WAV0_HETBA